MEFFQRSDSINSDDNPNSSLRRENSRNISSIHSDRNLVIKDISDTKTEEYRSQVSSFYVLNKEILFEPALNFHSSSNKSTDLWSMISKDILNPFAPRSVPLVKFLMKNSSSTYFPPIDTTGKSREIKEKFITKFNKRRQAFVASQELVNEKNLKEETKKKKKVKEPENKSTNEEIYKRRLKKFDARNIFNKKKMERNRRLSLNYDFEFEQPVNVGADCIALDLLSKDTQFNSCSKKKSKNLYTFESEERDEERVIVDKKVNMRRRSCHCNMCGNLTKMEKDTGDVVTKTKQLLHMERLQKEKKLRDITRMKSVLNTVFSPKKGTVLKQGLLNLTSKLKNSDKKEEHSENLLKLIREEQKRKHSVVVNKEANQNAAKSNRSAHNLSELERDNGKQDQKKKESQKQIQTVHTENSPSLNSLVGVSVDGIKDNEKHSVTNDSLRRITDSIQFRNNNDKSDKSPCNSLIKTSNRNFQIKKLIENKELHDMERNLKLRLIRNRGNLSDADVSKIGMDKSEYVDYSLISLPKVTKHSSLISNVYMQSTKYFQKTSSWFSKEMYNKLLNRNKSKESVVSSTSQESGGLLKSELKGKVHKRNFSENIIKIYNKN